MSEKEQLWEEIKNKFYEHNKKMQKLINNGIITNESEEVEYQKKFIIELNKYKEKRKKEIMM